MKQFTICAFAGFLGSVLALWSIGPHRFFLTVFGIQ